AALELDNAQEFALIEFGIVGGRLVVDHVLDTGQSVRRREGHDRIAVRIQLCIDRRLAATIDGRTNGGILRIGSAPVDNDRELFHRPQRRTERRYEGPKRVARDDANRGWGRRGRQHFAVISPDLIAVRFRHSSFDGTPADAIWQRGLPRRSRSWLNRYGCKTYRRVRSLTVGAHAEAMRTRQMPAFSHPCLRRQIVPRACVLLPRNGRARHAAPRRVAPA